jgi:hypothetical protein
MSEIVNGIKVIKMYTWEAAFSDLVQDVRKYVLCENFVNWLIQFCGSESGLDLDSIGSMDPDLGRAERIMSKIFCILLRVSFFL